MAGAEILEEVFEKIFLEYHPCSGCHRRSQRGVPWRVVGGQLERRHIGDARRRDTVRRCVHAPGNGGPASAQQRADVEQPSRVEVCPNRDLPAGIGQRANRRDLDARWRSDRAHETNWSAIVRDHRAVQRGRDHGWVLCQRRPTRSQQGPANERHRVHAVAGSAPRRPKMPALWLDSQGQQTTGEIVDVDADAVPGTSGPLGIRSDQREHDPRERRPVVQCVRSTAYERSTIYALSWSGKFREHLSRSADQLDGVRTIDQPRRGPRGREPLPHRLRSDSLVTCSGRAATTDRRRCRSNSSRAVRLALATALAASLRRTACAATAPGLRFGPRICTRRVRSARLSCRFWPAFSDPPANPVAAARSSAPTGAVSIKVPAWSEGSPRRSAASATCCQNQVSSRVSNGSSSAPVQAPSHHRQRLLIVGRSSESVVGKIQ